VRPALRAPLPAPLPAAFAEAERLEMDRPDLALAAYRRLGADERFAALASSRVARCLANLGRVQEAIGVWRSLADSYPDDRDPHGRPYGIVAAIQAGDTTGLLEQIINRRWELSADQAEHFVAQLGGSGAEAYLDRFRFARELAPAFRPAVGAGKTPITLVRLYEETLLRHDTLTIAERREFYRIITCESARLGRLVDQILSFASNGES